jgi:hypothetical protein
VLHDTTPGEAAPGSGTTAEFAADDQGTVDLPEARGEPVDGVTLGHAPTLRAAADSGGGP